MKELIDKIREKLNGFPTDCQVVYTTVDSDNSSSRFYLRNFLLKTDMQMHRLFLDD